MKPSYTSLPQKPGVYLFKDKRGRVLYVGKSVNLRSRVRAYFGDFSKLGPKTTRLVGQIQKIDYILVASEIEALLLEASLIRKHLPKFNARSKDDKSPLYIKISKEEFPKVLISRKNDFQKSDLGFGHCPSAKTVKSVYRLLRRIFPFCSCKKSLGRPCLYYHLGLCQPSPRAIIKLKGKEKEEQKMLYQKNIKNLVSFLQGKRSQLTKSFQKQMKKKAANKNFEEAARLRDQIQALQYITQAFKSPHFYLANPNLLFDQRRQELVSLFEILTLKGLPLKKIPARIEAFDISDFSGQQASGSMVTFINGEAEKNLYRRFKVGKGRPKERRDDSARLAEVLRRRFKHPEWGWPDLMIVDGGKPQVSVGQKVLELTGVEIPLIGLAKRREEIIFLKKGKFITLQIRKSQPAIHLVQRLRDEAHRFALDYHRFLRRKTID
jgi:excinuclease ABC subunit C